MIEPIRAYMKTGIILHVAYPEIGAGDGPVIDRLMRIIEDDSFDVVEIGGFKDPAVRAEAARLIKIAHMDVAYGAQGKTLGSGLKLCDTDEEGRKKAVEAVKAAIDEAAEIGCFNVQFMSGTYQKGEEAAAYDQLIRSTKELCAYAEATCGLPLVCEVFDYDIDKKALIGPASLAKQYAEDVCRDYPGFGLQVDLSHFPLCHETIAESVLPVRDYIRHAHMGNAVVKEGFPAYGDMHPRFGFPDSANDVPELAEYLRTLIDIGYLSKEAPGIVSFEVKPWGDEPSEAVIANAKRALALAWAQV